MAEMLKIKIEKLEKEVLDLKLKMAEMKGEMKVLREYRGYTHYPWRQPYYGSTGTGFNLKDHQILCGDTTTTTTSMGISNDTTLNTAVDTPNPLWGGTYHHGC
jgi:hypothetical protein